MSEAPTHAAAETPTPARPQQTPQQTTQQPPQQGERSTRTERVRQTERQAEQHAERPEEHEQRQSSRLEDEWRAVQYEFVDDPKAAVRKADGLVARALEELTSRHRSLTRQLEGNGDPQTEDLRLALHRYRELFKSLVAVK